MFVKFDFATSYHPYEGVHLSSFSGLSVVLLQCAVKYSNVVVPFSVLFCGNYLRKVEYI